MSPELLKKCMPYASDENCVKFSPTLTVAMSSYEINTARRQAAFLAQIAHESGSLRYTEEIASGEAYEGRKDLGNTQPGDGVRFKGRGLIQITGRANYEQVSKELNHDFVANPKDLALPGAASYSAAWFWWSRNLNRIADIDGFLNISRRINGSSKKNGIAPDGVGYPNGWQDRLEHWDRCKKALGVTL